MTSLGIDIGSSSVKVSLLNIQSGKCLAAVTLPSSEMPIEAAHPGWAEQDPDMWWTYVCDAIARIAATNPLKEIKSVGITYQMHGLVCIDKNGKPLRKSIIWCDSRAVETGEKAFREIGPEKCLTHLLNSPGNFTASKMAWVKKNEPEIFARTYKFFLPGDYIAYKLSGEICTTGSGLSEQILWDFTTDTPAEFVSDYYGIPSSYLPVHKPSLGIQSYTSRETEIRLGIPQGTPISYRAGDQPNNAFSLNVMDSGEIAATAGTSGVVYGITDTPRADKQSRVNPFLHVNHSSGNPRYGVLLCINGTGILNAWMRKNVSPELSYAQMNELMALAPAGSDGLSILPFGNGAERILENRFTGVQINGLDLNRHSRSHFLRAAHEGIAFSFRYGVDIMKDMGLVPKVIRAGEANMFLSPVFRNTLATLCDASIELYNTDGSLGAARGAAWGAGHYESREACFAGLKCIRSEEPRTSWRGPLEMAYQNWKNKLEKAISNI